MKNSSPILREMVVYLNSMFTVAFYIVILVFILTSSHLNDKVSTTVQSRMFQVEYVK